MTRPPLPTVDLDQLAVGLGKLVGKLAGAEDLQRSVEQLSSSIKGATDDQASRVRAATQLDKLIDLIAMTETTPELIPRLRMMSDWLVNPSAAKQAQVEALIADLGAFMGTVPALDPERQEAEQDAEIKRNVKESLDKIFSKPIPKPF